MQESNLDLSSPTLNVDSLNSDWVMDITKFEFNSAPSVNAHGYPDESIILRLIPSSEVISKLFPSSAVGWTEARLGVSIELELAVHPSSIHQSG